jgi:hypothetical protein
MGGVRFYDFSLEALVTGAIPIDAGVVQVIPFGGPNSPGLEFAVNATAGAGELKEIKISYLVEPLMSGPFIRGALLAMTGSFAAPDGVTTVVEELCPDPTFFGVGICESASPQALIVFDIGIDADLSESIGLPPTTRLGVIKDITVDGGINGSAAIGSAINQFVVVPEPGTVFAGISALAACVLFRARRRSR